MEIREIVAGLEVKMAYLTAQQEGTTRLLQQNAESNQKILEILQGTVGSPGISERMSRLETDLKSVQANLSSHITEHQRDAQEAKLAHQEDERDSKKRRWGLQDSILMLVIGLIASSLFGAIVNAVDLYLRLRAAQPVP